MTEESNNTVLLHEILVAVDTSAHSKAALEAAIALAKIVEANVRGVFVQDELWSQICSLPSITAVNTLTGQILPLENETMEDYVTLLRNRLRQKLEYLSKRNRVTHSWYFARGKVEDKILEAAKEADLITIGLKGTSTKRKILGSSARRIIQKADKPVLILKEGLRLGAVLTAVYDGSEKSRKGVELALQIAEKNESILSVLMLDNHPEMQWQQTKEIERMIEESPVSVKIEFLEKTDVSSFLNAVNKQLSGILFIPKDQPVLARSLQLILNHINCPLLLIN